jgi:nucleoside phosphorylase
MTLLILGAVEEEVKRLRHLEQQKLGIRIHCVGIGSVEAAANTSKLLAQYLHNSEQSLGVLFIGSVGAYDGSVEKLSLVVSSHTAQLDAASMSGKGFVPEAQTTALQADSELSEKVRCGLNSSFCVAGICSPPSITANSILGKEISEATLCDYENLELFGVALASQNLQVPWSSVCAVTNSVGAEAHKQWQQYQELAASQTAQALTSWLENQP